MFITTKKIKTNINQDWKTIRKQLIWAVIVNLGIAGIIFVQMYFNQRLIMYRLEKIENNQETLQREILNLYKNER